MKVNVILAAGLMAIGPSGCTTVSNALSPPYIPQALVVFNKPQYDADIIMCQSRAKAVYRPQFDIVGVGVGGVKGAASEASSAVVGGPLVAATGALDGASSATLDGLGVFDTSTSNVIRHCLYDVTAWDKSALLVKPEN